MHLSVITDELDPELAPALDACERLGASGVELRSIGGQTFLSLDDSDFSDAMHEIGNRGLTVTALASPIFKCVLPGTEATAGALHGAKATATLDESWELLDRALARAAEHGIPFVRIFSCWRVPEPSTVFEDVVALVAEAQRRAAGSGVELVLENEHDCNVATAQETAALLHRVPGLRVIWDPGNHVRGGGDPADAAFAGNEGRIAHVHIKDVDASGAWVPVGTGLVPFDEVLDGLARAGYDGALSLETHCEIDGSKERASAHNVAALTASMGAAR